MAAVALSIGLAACVGSVCGGAWQVVSSEHTIAEHRIHDTSHNHTTEGGRN
jgi:hypothetical protein